MTPCAKGDEAETEEIFLPTYTQKKREKSIARKIKEIVLAREVVRGVARVARAGIVS